jgi:hypothetical protein
LQKHAHRVVDLHYTVGPSRSAPHSECVSANYLIVIHNTPPKRKAPLLKGTTFIRQHCARTALRLKMNLENSTRPSQLGTHYGLQKRQTLDRDVSSVSTCFTFDTPSAPIIDLCSSRAPNRGMRRTCRPSFFRGLQ